MLFRSPYIAAIKQKLNPLRFLIKLLYNSQPMRQQESRASLVARIVKHTTLESLARPAALELLGLGNGPTEGISVRLRIPVRIDISPDRICAALFRVHRAAMFTVKPPALVFELNERGLPVELPLSSQHTQCQGHASLARAHVPHECEVHPAVEEVEREQPARSLYPLELESTPIRLTVIR